jgi:biopolymer transport protein ExbD
MAINFNKGREPDDLLIAEINTTPLVDVMLVLLIIFLITVPVVNSSVVVSLPRQSNQLQDESTENVIISVDASGAVYWADTRLPDQKTLVELLTKVSALSPQPEVHIRGDARADYEAVGRVVYAVQQTGIAKLGFITEPPPR